MTAEPIMVECAGAGCPVHFLHVKLTGEAFFGLCSMCGSEVDTDPRGNASTHESMDVIAMLRRGDFG